jgi:hypothetical protein
MVKLLYITILKDIINPIGCFPNIIEFFDKYICCLPAPGNIDIIELPEELHLLVKGLSTNLLGVKYYHRNARHRLYGKKQGIITICLKNDKSGYLKTAFIKLTVKIIKMANCISRPFLLLFRLLWSDLQISLKFYRLSRI